MRRFVVSLTGPLAWALACGGATTDGGGTAGASGAASGAGGAASGAGGAGAGGAGTGGAGQGGASGCTGACCGCAAPNKCCIPKGQTAPYCVNPDQCTCGFVPPGGACTKSCECGPGQLCCGGVCSYTPCGAAGAGGAGGVSGAGGAGASGASGAGGTPSFPAVLTGTWLVGWSGGLNHYSWLHFTPSTGGFDGELRVLSGQSLSVNAPLWNCDGVGSWTVTAKPMTVLLTFPAGCATAAESLTWTSFDAATFPMGANLHASIEAALTTGSPLEGFRFDDSQCDAAFTSCADPFPF